MIEISAADGPLTTEGIDEIGSAPEPAKAPAPVDSRKVRIAKKIGWSAFGIFCLLFFTLLKLPEERIKSYVQGMIASFLAPKGISFTAEKGYISLGWGISYIMKDVTLNFPPPDAPAHVDQISFTPSLLPMILGYQGGTLWLYNGDGKLHATFSVKDTLITGTFSAKALDLGKIGVLPLATGIHGSAIVSGDGSVSGDSALPSTLTGDLDLSLSKIVFDQQSIMGFSVPKLAISDGKIELNSDKGKATVKTFRIGKAGSADDIQATGSGDVVLGRNWDSSTLNGKVNLKLSDSVMKSFILIDALLGAGKQGDGSYSFQLTGALTAPNPVPIGAGVSK